MKETYHKIKQEEAKNAAIFESKKQIETIASLIDIDLNKEEQILTLKERISDLEILICSLLEQQE